MNIRQKLVEAVASVDDIKVSKFSKMLAEIDKAFQDPTFRNELTEDQIENFQKFHGVYGEENMISYLISEVSK